MADRGDSVAPLKAVSASQKHSGLEKELSDSFSYGTKTTEDVGGVCDCTDGQVDEVFVATVMKSLKKSQNERQLQDGVFNAMNALPAISIPEDCKKPPNAKDLGFVEKYLGNLNPLAASFSEKNMRELLTLYTDRYLTSVVEETARTAMKTTKPGLFARASSRPDMAAAVVFDGKGEASSGDVLTGEVKNSDNYTVMDAVNQEAAYLMLLLYWWKTFACRDVEAVYGFTICGPLCQDIKQRKRNSGGYPAGAAHYSICVLRLSAPTTLGGLPLLTYYRGKKKLSDDSDVRELCKFITSKSLWSRHKKAADILLPFPALFIAPSGLVQAATKTQYWSVVPNGTTSLVFRCQGKKGVMEIVGLMDGDVQRRAKQKWLNYLDSAGTATMYVKVSTSASCRKFLSLELADLQNEAHNLGLRSFLQTYPVPAVKMTDCHFVLMADRGKRVANDRWSEEKFTEMFRALWEETTQLSHAAQLYHGDIAKHNLLYQKNGGDEDRLVLVDWDEAQKKPKSRETEERKELSLIHPESLRRWPLLHTEVQLALLYWKLRRENVEGQSADFGFSVVASSIPGLQEYVDATESVKSRGADELAKFARAFVEKTKGLFAFESPSSVINSVNTQAQSQ